MSRKQHHAHAKHLYVRTNSWAEALKGLTMTDKYPGYTRHGHPIPGYLRHVLVGCRALQRATP